MKTRVTLSYFDKRLRESNQDLLERVTERFAIFDVDVKQRLHVLNDHKKAMDELRHEFPNIHRYETELLHMKGTLQELRDFKIQMKSTASQKELNTTKIIAIVGLIVSIITLIVLIIKTFVK